MESTKFRSIHDKFESGDSLTNDEVDVLLYFYDKLVAALDMAFLPKYRIMQSDAWIIQRRLKEIKEARRKK